MSKSIFFLLIGFAIGFTSCKKDEAHTSVIGSWNCEESSETGKRNYQVSINRNVYLPNAIDEYIISNFHNLGITESTEVYVREEGEAEHRILKITGTSAIGISFSGEGVIAPDFSGISWNYQAFDGGLNSMIRANYY